MPDFIHLHTHSDYSLLDGAASLDKLVERAVRFNMPSLALTDHGNMFGVLKFSRICKAAGIRPIIGSEFYVAPESRFKKSGGDSEERYFHLILLASGRKGYENLLRLSSLSYTEGFYYRPRIDNELLRRYSDELVCLSACLAGEIPSLIMSGREDAAEEKALAYRELFGTDRFYLELQDHGMAEQRTVNRALKSIASRTGIPLVATNDVHYPDREDARAQDVLICIGTNKKLHEGNRIKFEHPEFYFKSPEEMSRLFVETPEALSNTVRIAEMCRVEIPLIGPTFPQYDVPEGSTAESYLRETAFAGLQRRCPNPSAEAKKRLEYELDIICKMGFASYFLIVWDFIRFAREHGIPVGPGRGSGAGSLVAYALQITNIDPLEYGLLFERMLNPERVEPPDLDIDFCYERRGEVIEYVTRKYGQEKVGQIITFGTLKARAALRDVARVLDFPYADADRLAKLVPEGPKVTLKQALETDADLAEAARQNERYADLFEVTLRLEGLSRHTSTHAAGIVIGREELTHYVPVYRDSRTGAVSTQFSMEDLASCGLVKMDFLGLKTLTVIDKTSKMIRKRGIEFDLENMPLDDGATFDLLGQGKSTCVFQFEGSGMQGVLKRAKPRSIAELSDLNALYRPGPMENIDQYIDGKMRRRKTQYPLSDLKSILEDTFGVIIYQEQVMEIARKIAGYSLGQADILRSAMGKKKPDVMAREKERFIAGAVEKGHSREEAVGIFELLVPFAGYGFNKSHSAAYSLVAYQTAFLKANYPAEFMAANLTNEINDTDKLTLYIAEARSMGLEVLPPDINLSEKDFTVVEGRIIYGLCGIKNVGSGAAQCIVNERSSGGPYKSLLDFLQRVDLKTINKKVIEAFVLAGVMDEFGENRATLFQNIERLLEIGAREQQNRAFGQATLFESSQLEALSHVELESVEEWPHSELLRLEKRTLGFFFSGHPLDQYKTLLDRYRDLHLDRLDNVSSTRTYTVLGIVKEIKEHITRKGGKMAFARLEDDLGSIECVIFTRTYESHRELLEEDNILVLRGRIDTSRGDPKLLVDEVIRPEDYQSSSVNAVHIRLDGESIEETALYQLRDFVFDRSGKCSLFLHVCGDSAETVIRASSAITIRPDDDVLVGVQKHPHVAEVWKE